jgi:N-acetylglucosaminyldiphosphoundecaprenol N-acetyl-beta-D-mannosaminyltransferase
MPATPVEVPAPHEIGGLDLVPLDLDSAAQLVVDAARRPSAPHHIHLANAYTVALADRDPGYRRMLRADDALCFADGRPLGWVSDLRRLQPPLRQVRGTDLFLAVVDRGRASGLTHYLLGGRPETTAGLKRELERRFPGALIVGSDSPPFRELTADEEREQLERIVRSGAEVVWVGLGAPRQDHDGARITRELSVETVAVGAAFGFIAGTAAEAPTWMRRAGLEWLFRLTREPRRLWRRYLFGNARFIKAVAIGRTKR